MTWLWSSYEEFNEYVFPVARDSIRAVRFTKLKSWFECEEEIFKAVNKITNAKNEIREKGYTEHPYPGMSEEELSAAHILASELVYAGETLLLYHKKLAKSKWAYDFLHEKDIDEHWDRYVAEERIPSELGELVEAADNLIQGYDQLMVADKEFLIDDLDLPDTLKEDFILARNLFSVGFDEVGVLIAGRGLEGVLRKVAETRQIRISIKGKDSSAHEADFNDLIETMFRLRWKKDKSRFINQQLKTLLHFLRAIRNRAAHPQESNNKNRTSREQAIIISNSAEALWNDSQRKRAGFIETVIIKDW
jgi:hypothetical protein